MCDAETMPTPAADVTITADLIEALVLEQHPDLAGPVRILANGWDNVVARLGDELLVRLPRRAAAAALVEHEARWLPGLAEQLPVPVPAAVRVGAPTDAYPWTWLIVPWIDGVPVAEVPVPHRERIAADLAAAHLALHQPAPAEAPANPFRGVPLADRVDVAEQRLASGVLRHADELRSHWRRALEAEPYAGPPLWLHGDSHPGNLLASSVDADARLAALIDFGDITAGDPASDLAVAWLAFDATGRARYRAVIDEGGQVDADTWRRAHGWAILLLGAFASADDDPRMSAIAAHGLEQVLGDPPD